MTEQTFTNPPGSPSSLARPHGPPTKRSGGLHPPLEVRQRLLPERREPSEPLLGDLRERRRIERVPPLATFLDRDDEPCLAEYSEMARDRRPTDGRECGGEVAGGHHRSHAQEFGTRSPSRVSERLEDRVRRRRGRQARRGDACPSPPRTQTDTRPGHHRAGHSRGGRARPASRRRPASAGSSPSPALPTPVMSSADRSDAAGWS